MLTMKLSKIITFLVAFNVLLAGHVYAKENQYRVSPTEQLHQKLLKLYKLKAQKTKSFENTYKVNTEIETLIDRMQIDSSLEKELADNIVENNFEIN